jgi:hypothetical protein
MDSDKMRQTPLPDRGRLFVVPGELILIRSEGDESVRSRTDPSRRVRHNPALMKSPRPDGPVYRSSDLPVLPLPEVSRQPRSASLTRNFIVDNTINLAALDEHLTSIELLLKDLRKRVAEVAEAIRIAAEQQPNGTRVNHRASRNGHRRR